MSDEGMPALELPSNGKHGSGTGSSIGYKLEARTSYHSPLRLGDFVIDNVWREVPLREGVTPWGMNVPVKAWDRDMLTDCGLVSFYVAEAHRWSLLAFIESHLVAGSLCVQTRLVKIEYSFSYSTKELGVTPAQLWCNGEKAIAPRASTPPPAEKQER